jgi:hypothetical protein
MNIWEFDKLRNYKLQKVELFANLMYTTWEFDVSFNRLLHLLQQYKLHITVCSYCMFTCILVYDMVYFAMEILCIIV